MVLAKLKNAEMLLPLECEDIVKRLLLWGVGIFFGLPLAILFLFGPAIAPDFPPLLTLLSWGTLGYWIYRRQKRGKKVKPGQIYFWPGPGEYAVDVHGESHYQQNLERICGKRKPDGENKYVTARLSKEDDNPVDPNAVRVDINGLQVGYLPKELAPTFRQRLSEGGYSNVQMLECDAVIRGGWLHPTKGAGYYGVWLDLPTV